MVECKDENRVGLKRAVYNGTLWEAENAEGKIEYTCPYCGVRMNLTHSKNGLAYFARKPGEIHKEPECQNIELGKSKERSLEKEPEEFIASLCHIKSRKGGGSGEGGTTDPGHLSGNGGGEGKDGGLEYTSLKQMYDNGLYHLHPEYKLGKYKIGDYIVNYKSFEELSKGSFEIGSRIIWASFDGYYNNNNRLSFKMFKKDDGYIFFSLYFASKSEYKKYRDKLVKLVTDETGKTKSQKLNANVLIAGRWELARVEKPCDGKLCCKVPKTELCDKCRGVYSCVFTNPKQIFIKLKDSDT